MVKMVNFFMLCIIYHNKKKEKKKAKKHAMEKWTKELEVGPEPSSKLPDS